MDEQVWVPADRRHRLWYAPRRVCRCCRSQGVRVFYQKEHQNIYFRLAFVAHAHTVCWAGTAIVHNQGHLVHRRPRRQPSYTTSPNNASPSLQETSLPRPILRLPIRRRRGRSEQVHLLPPHRCGPRPMDVQDPPLILPPASDSRLACVQASPRNTHPRFQEPTLDQGPP